MHPPSRRAESIASAPARRVGAEMPGRRSGGWAGPGGATPGTLDQRVMDGRGPGLTLMILGAGLVVVGVLLWSGALSWFGRLPGDVRWEGERARVYVPIVSMIVVSVVLSLLLWIFRQR